MENEFDYMNDAQNTQEQPPVIQPTEEAAPQQPTDPYGESSYSYTYTPAQEPQPVPERKPKSKKSGRGAYICHSLSCFKKARKSKRLESGLNVQIPDEIYERLEKELSQE